MIFSIVSWIAIYFVVWWTSLFVVLPFVGQSQAGEGKTEEGEVVAGADPGAPSKFRWLKLVLLTTAVATAVFLLVMWVLTQDLFSLEDVPLLPNFKPV